MYQFRSFQNSDPPRLAELWNRQPPLRGLMQPMNSAVLESTVLAKSFFDRDGLIVATRDAVPVGFAHGGFGPTEDGTDVATDWGVTSMVMVDPQQPQQLAADLLHQSEAYLRSRGAKLLYAGEIRPLDPFYLGLYGGSELPGVLRSDTVRAELYQTQGYRTIDRVTLLHRNLATFRPPVDRNQMQLRRQMHVDWSGNPPRTSWWEACAASCADRVRFELRDKSGGPAVASASVWNMEPLASSWGMSVAGLTDVMVKAGWRRRGAATLLLAEVIRQLQSQGVRLIEAQHMENNEAARALYARLGFIEIDQGLVLRHDGASA